MSFGEVAKNGLRNHFIFPSGAISRSRRGSLSNISEVLANIKQNLRCSAPLKPAGSNKSISLPLTSCPLDRDVEKTGETLGTTARLRGNACAEHKPG